MTNPYLTGTDNKSSSPAKLAILVAVAWLLTGALFKLFMGNPTDLPPAVLKLSPVNAYETFRGAISIELCIALMALIWPRLGWILLVAIYVVFLALLAKLVASGAESCGCLGSSITLKPWHMMLIDGVILALLLWSRPWKRLGKTSKPLGRALLLLPLFAVAVVWPKLRFNEVIIPDAPEPGEEVDQQANAPAAVEGDFYLFEPEKWENQIIYDIDLLHFASPPGSMANMPGDALVVLYRKTCEHCKTHIADLAISPPPGKQIVLVRVPEMNEAELIDIIEMKPDGAVEFELQELPRGYGITTPLSFEVDFALMVTNVVVHEE